MKALKYILIAALATLVACQKTNLPEALAEEPVFTFQGTVDGAVLAMSAGVDDYYLFTERSEDGFGVPVYSGQLGPVGSCPAFCPESIKIELRQAMHEQSGIDPTFTLQMLGYYNGLVDEDIASTVLELTFVNNSISSEEATYEWDFGNGMTSNLKNPAPVIYDPGFSTEPFVITLTVTSASGCIATEVFNYDVENLVDPQCTLILNTQGGVGPSGLEICGSFDGVEPMETVWTSSSAFLNQPCQNVASMEAGQYSIVGTNDAGCTDSELLNVQQVGDEIFFCNASFTVEANQVPPINSVIDEIGLGTVNITYTDPDGVIYRSGAVLDQGFNTFVILSSSAYKENELGKATQQFDYIFDAWLMSDEGQLIEIKAANGTWAVGIE